ncbi:hypothetical protein PV326_013624 [Microctonus aethiopoides]|nr:hypothetical protein PV326_013624 [Microctonus aethiopoides]
MEAFGTLMRRLLDASVNPSSDMVAVLSLEIVELIFRRLDDRSLLNVDLDFQGNGRNLCKDNSRSRRTVRRHLQMQKPTVE